MDASNVGNKEWAGECWSCGLRPEKSVSVSYRSKAKRPSRPDSGGFKAEFLVRMPFLLSNIIKNEKLAAFF